MTPLVAIVSPCERAQPSHPPSPQMTYTAGLVTDHMAAIGARQQAQIGEGFVISILSRARSLDVKYGTKD